MLILLEKSFSQGSIVTWGAFGGTRLSFVSQSGSLS
jgi:hypothetical protein